MQRNIKKYFKTALRLQAKTNMLCGNFSQVFTKGNAGKTVLYDFISSDIL